MGVSYWRHCSHWEQTATCQVSMGRHRPGPAAPSALHCGLRPTEPTALRSPRAQLSSAAWRSAVHRKAETRKLLRQRAGEDGEPRGGGDIGGGRVAET